MFSLKGVLAVFIAAAILSVPLYYYWDFLTTGMRPPQSTQRLNELEAHGVPDSTLKDLGGKAVSLSQFQGKLVLVNFWATWCAPCVKEFPSLKRLAEAFKDDVVIMAVSYDKSREDIDSFIATFGTLPSNFSVMWDQEKTTASLFGTDVLPETYIVSRDRKLIRKVAGEVIWDEPSALDYFRGLLGKAVPGQSPHGNPHQ